jgi:L-aspartate oxidase
VFSKRVVSYILSRDKVKRDRPTFEKDYGNILHKDNDEMYKNRLRKVMWEELGIIRTKKGLHHAKNVIYDIKNKNIGRLLELRLNTASAIVDACLKRKESLGSHYIE